tara:strand:+ start:629 stop:1054 length:426 start_codon:yes stop_codon:yes gene_type:complete
MSSEVKTKEDVAENVTETVENNDMSFEGIFQTFDIDKLGINDNGFITKLLFKPNYLGNYENCYVNSFMVSAKETVNNIDEVVKTLKDIVKDDDSKWAGVKVRVKGHLQANDYEKSVTTTSNKRVKILARENKLHISDIEIL